MCTPMEGAVLGDDCGVYVDPNAADGGNGTKAMPFNSLVTATAMLGDAKQINVCGEADLAGSIELGSGVFLFGGFTCGATWTYAEDNPVATIVGDPDVPALTLSGSAARTIQSINVRAPNAVAAGASSIGVLAAGATATLRFVQIETGNGAPGVTATSPGKVATPSSMNGVVGGNGCMNNMGTVGGGGGQNTCQSSNREGGLGGSGTNAATNGGNGENGEPQPQDMMGGVGGKRQDGSSCDNGEDGEAGDPGPPGLGASSSANGTLSSSGFVGSSGLPGEGIGLPGGGGGGGGGANQCGAMGAGPSGGGGGAGGCGGAPGDGGGPGGASIGLVSVGASLTLQVGVRITTGNGGQGGGGAPGQEGQDGGSGGNPGMPADACSGGKGGNGGRGGAGGGGRGGPSIGIAFEGDTPQEPVSALIMLGNPGGMGPGGDGGTGNQGGMGAAGYTAQRQPF
jgi:hypothetical protein